MKRVERPKRWKWIHVDDEVIVCPPGANDSLTGKVTEVDHKMGMILVDVGAAVEGGIVTITALKQVLMSSRLIAHRTGRPIPEDPTAESDDGPFEFGIMELRRRTKEVDPERRGVSVLTLRKYLHDRPDIAARIPHRLVDDKTRPGKQKIVFTEDAVQAVLDIKNTNAQKWGPVVDRKK